MNQKIKKINSLRYFISFLTTFFPVLSFSQTINLATSDLGGVIRYLINVVALLNPILFALCFIAFFWGLSKFILNSGSEDEIKKGKNYMMWGLIALFVLISFRAIITLISSDLGLGGSTVVPQISI